jgi:hypothetical protein
MGIAKNVKQIKASNDVAILDTNLFLPGAPTG